MRISDWSSDVCSSDLAAEASHGDLGLIQPNSAVLILSNSGETSELSDLIHYCQVHGISTIALTANPDRTLARNATATIGYGKVTEVCPNGLDPTTSTPLSLAIDRKSTRINSSLDRGDRMPHFTCK